MTEAAERPAMEGIECPACGAEMALRRSKHGLFYGCGRYPDCTERHGAHPNGRPLGVPAKADVRALRNEVHELANLIWPWKRRKSKNAMYAYIAKNCPKGHIGEMDATELEDLKNILIAKINNTTICIQPRQQTCPTAAPAS